MPLIDWLALVATILAVWIALLTVSVYAGFVWIQTRAMKQQNLVLQESEWLPEVFFNAGKEEFYTRGKRPWFPEFKAEVGGVENEDGWIPNDFIPLNEDESSHGVEWVTEVPTSIKRFLRDFDEGSYLGKLYFQFETFTGEVYQIIYEIDMEVYDDYYEILEYPDMERVLPWYN